ncbi:MAG: ABC transporter permease [Rhodothermales bacterium]
MWRNYFKLAYRNLFKSKLSSFINIFGLSITIGCGILTYLYVHSEFSRDSFHQLAENIYLVEHSVEKNGEIEFWGNSPAPLAPALKANHPQVQETVRVAEGSALVVTEDFQFFEHVRFADPAFLSMFSFPLKYGNKDALVNKNGAVLSVEAAAKYFGEENPIGKPLELIVNDREVQAFVVTGVAEKLPVNTSLFFSILLPYEVLNNETEQNDWSNLVRATFVQVNNPADIQTLTPQMGQYVRPQNIATLDEHLITAYNFKNLKALTGNSKHVKNTIAHRVNWPPIIVLCTIAAFLLLLSCFNYMNVTLGSVHTRMKEIGVRKVMGSKKSQLIAQFLIENMLLCMISLVFGFIIATTMLIPGIEYITRGLNLTFSLAERADLWLFLSCLMITLGFISGAYPAFYISSFKPVTIIAGQFKTGGPNRFMQSLLTFQFVLAVIAVVLGVGLTMNNQYLKNVDWGYNNSNTFVVRLGPASYDVMYNAAKQLPNVVDLAGARNNVGTGPMHHTSFRMDDDVHEVTEFVVTDAYFNIIQPNVIQGTLPYAPDQILINEEMANALGFPNPVNQTVVLDSVAYNVAGLIQDFNFQNLSERITPAFFRVDNTVDNHFLAMRILPDTEQQTVENLATVWNANFPDEGFDHFFQESVFEGYQDDLKRTMNIFYFAAIFALLLSCAGLFGLVSQQISSRLKEMSIRKILGASISSIIQLANRKFLFLIALAFFIGMPISYLLLDLMLKQFAVYHMPLGPMPFVIALSLIAGTALLTLSSQFRRLSTANPADLLRNQ